MSGRGQDVRGIKKRAAAEWNAVALDAFDKFCGTSESRMQCVAVKGNYLGKTVFLLFLIYTYSGTRL
jgi:hypothetical protein